MAGQISSHYIRWDSFRSNWIADRTEIQKYVFATDTTKTTNSKLPWSNKTTIPKLCQIRDNLYANYVAALFPKRKWLTWEGDTKYDDAQEKRKAIESYMSWAMDRPEFYAEAAKIVLDYIDYGNCFATVEWVDSSSVPESKDGPHQQVGYAGPMIRRINPLDIVFNPTAPDFKSSPKIVRSIVSLGEIKEMLERQSAEEGQKEDAEALWTYLKDTRHHVAELPANAGTKDEIYQVAGFSNFRDYLASTYVEVLTFYGDIYNEETEKFERNQIIKVVDRHKILSKRTNPSFFGSAPIFHAGWRIRPDNLWAMGPLDNLVGMQYRIDHLENMKADCFDLVAYPPMAIKGAPEDFTWGPGERIYLSDDGEVSLLSPPVQALNADNQIAILEMKMEEMAGSPKEAMGFRTPGEKTMYEVQRLELAAGRIFQNKTAQIERDLFEHVINAMLELSRRNMTRTTIKSFNEEFNVAIFEDLSVEDITGNGRIKPIAARHFAEQATMVQNLNNFYASPAYQAVAPHFSTVNQAKLWECLLDLEDYNIVQPFIQISEQQEAQRFLQSAQEQAHVEAQTPTGFRPGDSDAILPDEAPQDQAEAERPLGGSPQGPGY